jgi:hypothetical protein
MVRMKLTKDEFDPKALDVKVEKSTFKRYRGEIPPNGTILIFRVTRMWWTQSKAGDSQIYLLAFAEQNKGKLAQYNGLPVREYLTFNPDAAFRYQNFLHNFGLTTRDIYNKMDVEPEPDSIGDVINSIGDWVVGSDDALCRIALVRDRYDPDELKAKVDKEGWLPLDEDDEPEDVDDEDDDDLDDEDEEDEEPLARPTRSSTRGAARTRQATPSGRGRRRDEPEEDDEEEDIEDEAELDDEDIDEEDDEQEEEDQDEEQEEEDEPPARPARRSRNTGRSISRTRPAATTTGRRGSGTSRRTDGERTRTRTSTARAERTPGPRGSKARDGGSTEDPPF